MSSHRVSPWIAFAAAIIFSLAPAHGSGAAGSLEEVAACARKALPPSAHGAFVLIWKSGKGEERRIDGKYWVEQPEDSARKVIVASSGGPGGIPAAYLFSEGDTIGEVLLATADQKTARRIQASGTTGELFGTDITFEDFARFARIVFPGQVRRLDDTTVEGRPAYVVQMTPALDEGSQYERIVSAVDKEWCIVIRRECFEAAFDGGKVARKVISSDPKAVKHEKGFARASHALMTDAKDGSTTQIELVDLSLDEKLPADFFAPEKLAEKAQ